MWKPDLGNLIDPNTASEKADAQIASHNNTRVKQTEKKV
jgi:hypothetical protein